MHVYDVSCGTFLIFALVAKPSNSFQFQVLCYLSVQNLLRLVMYFIFSNLWWEPQNSISCHQTIIQSKVILQCFTQPNPYSTLLILLSIIKCVAMYRHGTPEALSTNKKKLDLSDLLIEWYSSDWYNANFYQTMMNDKLTNTRHVRRPSME